MTTYTALLLRTAEHQYAITFPDFKGLQCTAITQELVKPLAEAVLASHLEELLRRGRTPPEPCTLQKALLGNVDSIALLIEVQPRYNSDFRTRLEQPAMGAAA